MQLHDEQALPASVTLLIDYHELGDIYTDKSSQLSSMQVQALLAVVTTNAVIEVGAGKQRRARRAGWTAAVLSMLYLGGASVI